MKAVAQILWGLCLILLTGLASANVEKIIFLGPPTLRLPQNQRPNIRDLHLDTLTPNATRIRTDLPRLFPAKSASGKGTEQWIVLANLEPSARYEMRVCWVATSPTAFEMREHTYQEVMGTPALIQSLAAYSDDRIRLQKRKGIQTTPTPLTDEQSLLFVRIFAAADYVSSNKNLMDNPPDVTVDLILDPFLYGVFPQSLVPTAVYIVAVAIAAWIASSAYLKWLKAAASSDVGREKTD